jgi:O-antigen/teichoic acid export membrane protein
MFFRKLLNTSRMNLLVLVAQSLIVSGIGIFNGVLSARSLEVADRGFLVLLLLIPQIYSRISLLGTEYVILREWDSVKYLDVRTFFLFSTLNSLLFLPVLILLCVFSGVPLSFCIFFWISANLISIIKIISAIFIHQEQPEKVAQINLIQAFGNLALYALAFNSQSAAMFFYSWIGTIFISVISALKLFKYNFTTLEASKGDFISIFLKCKKYLSIFFSDLMFSFSVESLVISNLRGTSTVGIYSISSTIANFSTIPLTFYVQMDAKNKKVKIVEIFAVLLFCGVLFIISPYILNLLYGNKYADAQTYLGITFLAALSLGISRFLNTKFPLSMLTQLGQSLILVFMILSPLFLKFTDVVVQVVTAYLIFSMLVLLSTCAAFFRRSA